MASRKINKQTIRYLFYGLAGALFLIIFSLFWDWFQFRKATMTRYPEFGILIPEKYSIHGIDVSRYQSVIAWDEVKQMKVKNIQLSFSFIKATEGSDDTDPQFYRNWKNAKDNQIIRGAYHYFISSKDAKKQAANFIKRVKLESGDLPPVLDIEQINNTDPDDLKSGIKQWLDFIENNYQVKPIIYTNADFYTNYLGTDFDAYPLWIAHYYQVEQPRINRSWLFWQHSDQGRVNGIIAKVDFNVFNGDTIAFKRLLIP